MVLPNTWFDDIGLINLERYEVGILTRLPDWGLQGAVYEARTQSSVKGTALD